jgi:surface antigen
MTTAEQVLTVARAELGTEEVPSGSNNVKYNDWYYGRPVRGDAYPWCAVFQSWVADRAGATAVIPKHAYTPAGAAWFQSRGQWSRTPKIGSLVYYQWSGMGRISHVGIVEAVNSDGSWIAIEGNTDGGGSRTGGKVMRQRRVSLGSLGGFGHPAYAAAQQAPAVAPAAAPASSSSFPGQTGRGATGIVVKDIQDRLVERGFMTAAVRATGYGTFGPQTQAAVTEFQRQHGLQTVGYVGPKTWAALHA